MYIRSLVNLFQAWPARMLGSSSDSVYLGKLCAFGNYDRPELS
jgi:hypothetical protein